MRDSIKRIIDRLDTAGWSRPHLTQADRTELIAHIETLEKTVQGLRTTIEEYRRQAEAQEPKPILWP